MRKEHISIFEKLLIFAPIALALAGCATTPIEGTQSTLDPAILPHARSTMTAQALDIDTMHIPTHPILLPSPTTKAIDTLVPPIPSPTSLPALTITEKWPSNWPQMTSEQIFSTHETRILLDIRNNPDQIQLAQKYLPESYLQASVRIVYTKPDGKKTGGSGTVIAADNTHTYILTANHINPPQSRQMTISQGVNTVSTAFSSDAVSLTHLTLPWFEDIGLIVTPNLGIAPFEVNPTNWCITQNPPIGEALFSLSYPYVDKAYSTYSGSGFVDMAETTNCWHEAASNTRFIPTTIPVVPGSSGSLVLDEWGNSAGIVKAGGPNGAQIIPLFNGAVDMLLAQAGYTGP